jgi:serine/threonine-protein kinase
VGSWQEPGALPPGTSFAGRYRVERALGSGAGGRVYAALDERSGRRVALKVRGVRKGPRAAQLSAQFEREYHTLCQLSHPSIVAVDDYGVDGDDAYYTMELLDGQDLHGAGRLSPREVCLLLRDVTSALSVLHARRLLHRDLSARNVRLTSGGHAKLIDFGAMTTMGVSTFLVGTPPFVIRWLEEL